MIDREPSPQDVGRAALSGALATVPMTAAMVAMHWMLPPSQREPMEWRQITEVLLRRLGLADRLSDCQKADVATALHFGYGTSVGAASAVFARHTVPQGLAYGLAVWAAGYCGWLPAAGILPPPHRRPLGRNALLILGHLVWGASLMEASRRLGVGRSGAVARV